MSSGPGAQPVIKEGDLVTTPSGRMARVIRVGERGERDLRYLDLSGEEVTMRASHLTLICSAPVRPWPTRVLK
jgi:preprotein translocase subunit YajC